MGSDSSGFYFTLHLSLQAIKFARVVELVDTLDLGSSALTGVGVRVPPLVHIPPNICYIHSFKKRSISEHFCKRDYFC